MKIYNVSELKTGTDFSAIIDGKSATGKIFVSPSESRIYLCQDAQDGSRCADRLGYKFSWSVRVGHDGTIHFDMDSVRNFEVITPATEASGADLTAAKKFEYLFPHLVVPGTKFKGFIKGTPVEGVLHSNGKRVWMCFNAGYDGETSPNKHGYLRSWTLGTAEVMTFPIADATITEYEYHPEMVAAAEKLVSILKSKDDFTKTVESQRGLFTKFASVSEAFGYTVKLLGDGKTYSFGCGEVLLTRDELAGFAKTMRQLKRRSIAEVDKAIEVAEKLAKQ